MGKTVAVAAERDAFADLFLYSAPGITMVHHAGNIVILVSNVVKL